MKPTLVADTEVFRDYFLLAFRNVATGSVRHFEAFDGHPLDVATVRMILARYRIVTFNGNHFDMPLIGAALAGAPPAEIKGYANKIILNNEKPWRLGLEAPACDHIDLIEVAPGFVSLKAYGARMHHPTIQELPIDPEASIAPEDRATLRAYCENDLSTTQWLLERLAPQIALRETLGRQYGLDLRSKSDAQIAEAVIRSEVGKLLGRPVPKAPDLVGAKFRYEAPRWVRYSSQQLRDMLAEVQAAEFVVLANGTVSLPDEVKGRKIALGASVYRMGIGGLHSSETSVAHHADADTLLVDRDVTSYYPAIILGGGWYPKHMGPEFLKVYRSLVDARVAAKRSGDKVTADALKITVNGTFGKLGSPFSILYAPRLLIQTTLTGQLALLMLIEMLESEGIPVVSANTDGIVIKCPRSHAALMDYVVWEWEVASGFTTEATAYRAVYSRDINNYFAIKEGGGYKAKGAFAAAAMQKHPTAEICSRAVVQYLLDGTPVETTIGQCRDIRMFITVRQVNGGALDQAGRPLGRTVRWIYSTAVEGPLRYKVNGYTVPRSEGARPVQALPDELPADLDVAWYVLEAEAILRSVGVAVEEWV